MTVSGTTVAVISFVRAVGDMSRLSLLMTREASSWPLTRSAYDVTRWIAKLPPWKASVADWSEVDTNSRAFDWYCGVVRKVTMAASATTTSSDVTMTRHRRRTTLR